MDLTLPPFQLGCQGLQMRGIAAIYTCRTINLTYLSSKSGEFHLAMHSFESSKA
jgi:hypothetical protein